MKTNKDNQILKRGQDALAARCDVGAVRERVGYESTAITKSLRLLISQLHTPKYALRKTSNVVSGTWMRDSLLSRDVHQYL